MGRVYAIALNAFREAIRDRILFGVLGLAAASLLFGASLAWISLNEQVRVLVDHGVVTISWLSNLVAVFLGASFLYKEIELRTLYVILAKPVARWEFVLGKYLGIVTTAVVFVALTGSMLLLLLDFQAAEAAGEAGTGFAWLSHQLAASRSARLLVLLAGFAFVGLGAMIARRVPAVARAREAAGAAVGVVLALALLLASASLSRAVAPVETRFVLLSAVLVTGEVAITAAVAMLFSAFSTPFVTGMLTVGVFLIGRSTGAMLELKSRQVPPEVLELLRGVATVVPNLHLYVPARYALVPRAEGAAVGAYLANALSYSALYSTLLLLAAAWLFRRRDLV